MMPPEVQPNQSQSPWSFPTEHNVKAIGFQQDPIQSILESIIKDLNLNYTIPETPSKLSKNGKYLSVTLLVTFTSESDVKALYSRLHAHPKIVQSL